MTAPPTALLVNLGPLMPEHPIEIILGIVLVLIITWACAKFIVPRFEDMYHERSETIQGGIERAEKAQQDARAALEQYQAQLAGARDEAAQIREDAKTQGAQIVAEMRTNAQAEANRISAQASAQIKAQRDQAVAELRREIGGLATNLAGRIVGESLDDDERVRSTVDRFLSELAVQPAKSSQAVDRA
ncbi:F0F1 ATP synthase subunit B [Acidipropionibacterium jensenii]|uniref:ATP synthase subunit b n=1 Tax=Acidipropionibacterium jensenii TaxID=1749 RepID=A0A3Q9UI46_9ACTN|nr:F0F1 ATP synthase subunit B [Acidipropionibacterium jensenii]AZZ39343.1 F0F1 ATP synthase subunit B [Acidipropionibacterium jensenii]QCV88785.1 F0F1 ATP synthase subunit B [Acidipropionibacterium jensenii]